MKKMKGDAAGFDRIAREIFAPIYPVIAEQMCTSTGITSGSCLDLGAGTGLLGISLARAYDFEVTLFDADPAMLEFAVRNINEHDVADRVSLMCGDVHAIKLDDDSMDLVVSRGSVFFWHDQAACFREIYRVIRQGGRAVIGGGFGNRELADEIDLKMTAINKEWHKVKQQRISACNAATLEQQVIAAGLEAVTDMSQDEKGLWITFKK